MGTQSQIDANRRNAQKSTGPKTPEGRAAVRLNGVTHGLTAETIVLKGESEADFTNLLGSLEAEHDPVTPTEEALVVQLAMATWRLRRLYHAEADFPRTPATPQRAGVQFGFGFAPCGAGFQPARRFAIGASVNRAALQRGRLQTACKDAIMPH